MSTALDNDLLAIHGLAVKKAGTAADVAAIIGASEEDVTRALSAARDAGRVIEAKGMYMVTPKGRAWLVKTYPTACADLRANDAFLAAYEQFEVINRRILDLFTRWQTVKVAGQAVPNDHSDEDYDNKIIDELGDIHDEALDVFEAFAAVEPRFAVYRDRFEVAYDRVLAGDIEWVSGAKLDSYHTVWFELHEDILRLLGRARTES